MWVVAFLAWTLSPQATRSILSEEAFHKMISLERKRTERSHKPFLLMLLDMGKEMAADGGRQHAGQDPGCAISGDQRDGCSWLV